MSKKQKRQRGLAWIWKGPCGTAAVLLLLTAAAAMLLKTGILKLETLKPALLVCCLIAGLAGAVISEKGEKRTAALLLSGGIPALWILAALLLAGEGREWGYSLGCALLLLLPGAAMAAGGKKGGKRRYPAKGRRTA